MDGGVTTGMDRPSFLSRGAALAGGSLLASGSLQTLTTRLASATPGAAPGQEKRAATEGCGRWRRTMDGEGRPTSRFPSGFRGEEIITTIAGKKHGYNFEVPLARSGPALTQPLVAMGRFAHEAAVRRPWARGAL